MTRTSVSVLLLTLLATLVAAPCSLAAEEVARVTLQAGGDARVVRFDTRALASDGGRIDAHWVDTGAEGPRRGLRLRLVRRLDGGGYEDLTDAFRPGAEIALWAQASGCCRSQETRTEVIFSSANETLAAVPVRLQVEGSWLRCALPWVSAAVGGLVAFLLSGALVNSWFLLPPEGLAEKVEALRWLPNVAHWTPDPAPIRDPLPSLQNALRPRQRLRNWWQSRPYRFCLPGQRYRETLQLSLWPTPWAELVSTHDLEARMGEDPTLLKGKLYLRAQRNGKPEFLAVVDEEGRIRPNLEIERVRPTGKARLVGLNAENVLYRRPAGNPNERLGWRLTEP